MGVSDVTACVEMLNENVRVVAPDEFVKLIKANLGDQPTSSKVLKQEGEEIDLQQNYPNPVTDVTTIRYYLPENVGKISLSVLNLRGQVVKNITKTAKTSGFHEIKLSVGDLNPGVYLYKLKIEEGSVMSCSKLMIVK